MSADGVTWLAEEGRKAEVKIGLTMQPVLIYVIALYEKFSWNANIT